MFVALARALAACIAVPGGPEPPLRNAFVRGPRASASKHPARPNALGSTREMNWHPEPGGCFRPRRRPRAGAAKHPPGCAFGRLRIDMLARSAVENADKIRNEGD